MALKDGNIVTKIILMYLTCVLNYAECRPDSVSTSEDVNTNKLIAEPFDRKGCHIEELDNKSWTECGEKGYMMNCSDLNLQNVPRTYPALNRTKPRLTPPLCVLNLSYNHIVILGNNSFVDAININSTDVRLLYIQYSRIEYIESNAFLNLSKLVYLNLAGNNLKWPGGFGLDVFRPLVGLEHIDIHGNKITTFIDIGRQLQYMQQLKELHIDFCENCSFGKDFENLTNLTTLRLSQIKDEKSYLVPTINNRTFRYVPNVQRMFLASCNIRNIEAGAFSPLNGLIELDLSDNEDLNFHGMNKALYGLRNSTTLKILNVYGIHGMYGLGVMVSMKDMENLKTFQSLEVLKMDRNKIEVLEEQVPSTIPKTVKNLTLSGNRFSFGKYVQHLNDVKGVVYLDMSEQHAGYDPFFYKKFDHGTKLQPTNGYVSPVNGKCNCSKLNVLCIPEKLETLNWSRSYLVIKAFDWINHPMILYACGAKHLKKLDFSFNLISTWKFIIHGFENMTDLDFSANGCNDISTASFATFTGLKRLNISYNWLGVAFDKIEPHSQPYIFKSLAKLEELDLSSNMLTHLHKDMFTNLSHIKRLYLSNNLLTNWCTSLVENRCLELLSLKNNKLTVLDETTTTYLDSLTTKQCYNGTVVDLSDNPLDCDCDHLNFLRWLRDTQIKVKLSDETECSIKGKRYRLRNRTDLKEIMHILESDVCKDKRWVTWVASVLSVVCTGFLSAVGGTLIYKHRWKLRYLYYTRHRRHILEGYDRLFQYDVFISYARTLGSFMKHSAVPMLEETHQLTTWAYDKDSIPGVSMAENITHAINNSKKAVLLLNREFLKDSWCEYETNMAYVESITTNRNMVIIVLMEQIPGEELPLYLHRLLMAVRSVEYPENGQDENTFWMNLAGEIRS